MTADRIRTLLLRSDNQLKAGRPGRAREALAEAQQVAAGADVDARLRELVERRIASLEPLLEGHAPDDTR